MAGDRLLRADNLAGASLAHSEAQPRRWLGEATGPCRPVAGHDRGWRPTKSRKKEKIKKKKGKIKIKLKN